jgi:aspartate dehydrogenase
MPDIQRVIILGAGTIGTAVGAALAGGEIRGLELAGYVVRGARDDLDAPAFGSIDAALADRPFAVVEAAGHDAVAAYAAPALRAGVHVVCLSVGALADARLRAEVEEAARRGGGRLLVPSGAVGALDLLSAAAAAGLDEVVVEQRKPPRTLLDAAEAAVLEEPRVVFDGPVADVVARYPKTTNVAAAVALAGLGFDDTRAVVVADPALRANRAAVSARGAFGSFRLVLDNVATANPRTSAVTAASVVATLRRLVEPLVVPA